MNTSTIKRVTGLLVIEVVNSNPNGNPDQESDPRVRSNGLGEISPVSFKRKLRDLVEWQEGPVYNYAVENLTNVLEGYEFQILEARGRDRNSIVKELNAGQEEGKFSQEKFLTSPFVRKYWDGRLFGNTFLEDGGEKGFIKTGVAQFGMGLSICPVIIQRQTNTNKAGVQKDKKGGMAPLAYRVVEHGVYVMPFFVNPSLAHNSGCKACDVELLRKLIPYAYEHTRSAIRPDVRIRHAWWMEHRSPLGSCPDYKLIDALTPKRKGDDDSAPSESWSDYDVPSGLPEDLYKKVDCVDLIEGL